MSYGPSVLDSKATRPPSSSVSGHILLRSRFGRRQGPEPQARVDRPVAPSACSEARSVQRAPQLSVGGVLMSSQTAAPPDTLAELQSYTPEQIQSVDAHLYLPSFRSTVGPRAKEL